MGLKRLRKAIDSIDSEILGLLNKRAGVTLEVGRLKAKGKASVYVPDREVDVYKKLTAKNRGPLSSESIKAIYREIMSGALRLEKALTIAYLGPELTFTHLASLKKFGSSVDYASSETITDVFSEVEKERADYGVVPIENSVEGAVNHTLDMFMESGVKICSEVYLEISHSLLSRESGKSKIKKVYSNPQV
ncbi:MAG: chorismate mutase, partial [Candidatus Omnitrophota bacterium]|nr:chorismate mutase [Candidatus Omnitrophota bacterium]